MDRDSPRGATSPSFASSFTQPCFCAIGKERKRCSACSPSGEYRKKHSTPCGDFSCFIKGRKRVHSTSFRNIPKTPNTSTVSLSFLFSREPMKKRNNFF